MQSNLETRPKLGQEDIRNVFGVGQKVLVRSGTKWRTAEILGITVLRHDVYCPHCGMPLLGEPRFWFKSTGNDSLEDIIAKEDIVLEQKQPDVKTKPISRAEAMKKLKVSL